MTILVIPDVHLKPWMFRKAEEIMEQYHPARVVCLMDIPDDWKQEFNLDLYEETYDTAIRFAKTYPDTLWCYGNHDICYVWRQLESGYSPVAAGLVREKLEMLRQALPSEEQLTFMHRIDNVLFSHAGLSQAFVNKHVPEEDRTDTDHVIQTINSFSVVELWKEDSPIWLRPQIRLEPMFREDTLLQVVGHTPVTKITKQEHVISCDVFSTYRDGSPIGTEEFLMLDTETFEYQGVPGSSS